MPDWIGNVSLFLLGALMVGVFAHRQFEMKSGYLETVQPEILETTPLRLLAGKAGYGRGLLLYVIMFEATFILLSTSTLLFSIAYELANKSDLNVVGFASLELTNEGSGTDLVSRNALVPVVVAGIIVSVANFPLASDIEALLRSIAHSVSGIPRNVYDALDKIKKFNFLDNPEASNPSIVNACEFAKTVFNAANLAGVDKNHLYVLENQIARIYSLEPWLNGELTLFSAKSKGELLKITRETTHASSALRIRLMHAVDGKTDKDEWETLLTEVMEVSDSMSAAFGVYALNNPRVRAQEQSPVIDALLLKILERPNPRPINTVIGTLLWGSVGALIIASSIIWLAAYVNFNANPEASGTSEYIDLILGDIYRAVQNGFLDVLSYSVLFLVASISALSLRSSKIENDTWVWHSQNNAHYYQYTISSLIIWIVISIPFQIIFSSILETLPQVANNFQDSWNTFRNTLDVEQLKSSVYSSVVVVPLVWSVFKFTDISEQYRIRRQSESEFPSVPQRSEDDDDHRKTQVATKMRTADLAAQGSHVTEDTKNIGKKIKNGSSSNDVYEGDVDKIDVNDVLKAALFIFLFVAFSSGFFSGDFGDVSSTLFRDFLREVIKPLAVFVCYLVAMVWMSKKEYIA